MDNFTLWLLSGIIFYGGLALYVVIEKWWQDRKHAAVAARARSMAAHPAGRGR